MPRLHYALQVDRRPYGQCKSHFQPSNEPLHCEGNLAHSTLLTAQQFELRMGWILMVLRCIYSLNDGVQMLLTALHCHEGFCIARVPEHENKSGSANRWDRYSQVQFNSFSRCS
jgi:hypothetical protein